MTLMNLTLHVWRQRGPKDPGKLVKYDVPGVSEHMSFLEMLDVLNERLTERGEAPIAFGVVVGAGATTQAEVDLVERVRQYLAAIEAHTDVKRGDASDQEPELGDGGLSFYHRRQPGRAAEWPYAR